MTERPGMYEVELARERQRVAAARVRALLAELECADEAFEEATRELMELTRQAAIGQASGSDQAAEVADESEDSHKSDAPEAA